MSRIYESIYWLFLDVRENEGKFDVLHGTIGDFNRPPQRKPSLGAFC